MVVADRLKIRSSIGVYYVLLCMQWVQSGCALGVLTRLVRIKTREKISIWRTKFLALVENLRIIRHNSMFTSESQLPSNS